MKLLLLGARGTVGTEIQRVFGGRAELVALGHAEADIGSLERLREVARASAPTHIVNAAAFTHVDGCDTDPEKAYLVNAIGAENVGLVAEELGAVALHFSTDYVFDGSAGRAYDEFDTPAPLAEYGRSKLAGERLFSAATRRHYVQRIGHVYGTAGKNFGSTLYDRLARGEAIGADRSRTIAPTWARNVAEQVLCLFERSAPFGLYHATSQGSCTWYEFALELQARANLGGEVKPIEATGGSPRPVYSPLTSKLLGPRQLQRMPHWREALEAYLASRGEEIT